MVGSEGKAVSFFVAIFLTIVWECLISYTDFPISAPIACSSPERETSLAG